MKYMINVRVCVREISVTVDVIISSFCCVGLFLFSLFIYFFFKCMFRLASVVVFVVRVMI